MNSETIAKAEQTLREFWAAMHAWETNALPQSDKVGTDKIEPVVRELQAIYERYLVPKDRKYGRLTFVDGKPRCGSIGFPPEYDPARETIVGHEVKNEKAIIFNTELVDHAVKTMKTPQRYQLVFAGDTFRIAKKEKFSSFKDKWVLLHL